MPGMLAEDLRHADRERHGAAGPADTFSPTCACRSGRLTVGSAERAEDRRRRVDGEVVAGVERRGGDERHDADERLRTASRRSRSAGCRSPCRSSSASCRWR